MQRKQKNLYESDLMFELTCISSQTEQTLYKKNCYLSDITVLFYKCLLKKQLIKNMGGANVSTNHS